MGGGGWNSMLQSALHLSSCDTTAGKPWPGLMGGEGYWQMPLGHLVNAQMSSGVAFSSSSLIHFLLAVFVSRFNLFLVLLIRARVSGASSSTTLRKIWADLLRSCK